MDCPPSRGDYLYMAMVAEEAERFEELRRITDEMVRSTYAQGEFTAVERNLIAFSHKKLVDARRASWRKVASVECGKEKHGTDERPAIVKSFRERIEAELEEFCCRSLSLLDSHLIPSSSSSESKVFFLKMKGDYYRYLAEFNVGFGLRHAALSSFTAYKEAEDIALVHLDPTNPTRLGLALNFSVLCFEILNLSEKARKIAQRGFKEAIKDLDELTPNSYKHATLQLELLRYNFTHWNHEDQYIDKRDDINSWSST